MLAGGEIRAVYRKRFLPNYGVFDENRYFASGNDLLLLRFGDAICGVTICEDIWQPGPPTTDLALAGAQLVVNLSSSPFHVGKDREREEMLRVRARDNSCFIAYCNLVGGQDELMFDGTSVVLDDEGELVARARSFEEELLVVDVDPVSAIARRLRDVRLRSLALDRHGAAAPLTLELGEPRHQETVARPEPAPPLDDLEQMRLALELGLRDYVRKNGFGDVVIGLSGGIDSAVTAAVAVSALGAERVHGVSMPSRYSSEGTQNDARRLAESLGIDFREIADRTDGRGVQRGARAVLRGPRAGPHRGEPPGPDPRHAADGALEQVRLARDRDRQQVRALGRLLDPLRRPGRWVRADQGRLQDGRLPARAALNERAGRELIPESIIDRPPSAELRADQRDEDSLPPYAKLDRVLEAYVERDRSRDELAEDGFEPEAVDRAIAMIDRAEYKRRQAPPGVKLRPKAFGRDRRTPITNRWRG